MKFWLIRTSIVLPIIAAVGGCLSLGAGFSLAEPQLHKDRYSLVEGSRRSTMGCRYDYRVFEPEQPVSTTSIMLGHGFLRNQDRLVELSRALANSGIRTITLNFCNMRPWNGNHQANSQDMQQLAVALGRDSNIVFGGFSAGALAAILAADERTKAIFALDFVDQAKLGETALRNLQIPLIGLHGPASGCNANNQGESVVARHVQKLGDSRSRYDMVDDASHCEFESPSNWLCEAACADDDPVADNLRTRQSIIDRSIELIRAHLSPPA